MIFHPLSSFFPQLNQSIAQQPYKLGGLIFEFGLGIRSQKLAEDGCFAEVTNLVSWRKLLTAMFQLEWLICPPPDVEIMTDA